VAGVSETLTGRHVSSGDDPEQPDLPVDIDDQPTEALAPPLAVPTPTDAPAEQVTCPECGTVAMVALTRRESGDFCVTCDFPLFWTPSKVALDRGDTAGDSLRRLPGTSGRVAVGSIACPHCAEGNPVTAELCLRCGGLMNPPTPEPVVVAPPPPPAPPDPEPERTPLWVWILGGTTLLLLVALVVYFLV
jgi:hypothetical protein